MTHFRQWSVKIFAQVKYFLFKINLHNIDLRAEFQSSTERRKIDRCLHLSILIWWWWSHLLTFTPLRGAHSWSPAVTVGGTRQFIIFLIAKTFMEASCLAAVLLKSLCASSTFVLMHLQFSHTDLIRLSIISSAPVTYWSQWCHHHLDLMWGKYLVAAAAVASAAWSRCPLIVKTPHRLSDKTWTLRVARFSFNKHPHGTLFRFCHPACFWFGHFSPKCKVFGCLPNVEQS